MKFKQHLKAGEYSEKIIERSLSGVNFASRQSASTQSASTHTQEPKGHERLLPFVTMYHPAVTTIATWRVRAGLSLSLFSRRNAPPAQQYSLNQHISTLAYYTTVVENPHTVSHFKHETFTALQYSQDFGIITKESLKRVTKWAAKYFTHEKSFYPVPQTSTEFVNVHFTNVNLQNRSTLRLKVL